jgi:iron complex outermembrane receptor protein
MNNKLLQKLAGVIALCCLFLITWTAQAQERKVTGKVLSAADGQGLPGASVMVKGTKVGVATGAGGEFTIAVKGANDVLLVTSVGFQNQEVRVDLNLILQ